MMAPRRASRVDRSERVAVFGKTKLCKFNILGVCSKGRECNFAHDASQLHNLPDLAKTRVCKTLISTGQCGNPDCLYAHNKDELREMPSAPEKTPAAERHQSYETAHAAQRPDVSSTLHDPRTLNFALAFGQAHSAQMQDPLMQAMMLQQMAAHLSMQAAMLQAQPSPAQFPAQQRESLQSSEPKARKILVDLSSLTSEPFKSDYKKVAVSAPASLPTDFTFDSFSGKMSPHNLESESLGALATFDVLKQPVGFGDRCETNKKNFQDAPVPQCLQGFTVKNTFLDFQPEQQACGMRAVQTYSGGLTFMTGSDDDDDSDSDNA